VFVFPASYQFVGLTVCNNIQFDESIALLIGEGKDFFLDVYLNFVFITSICMFIHVPVYVCSK
jgi:hypothetical protein